MPGASALAAGSVYTGRVIKMMFHSEGVAYMLLRFWRLGRALLAVGLLSAVAVAQENPFLGRWALSPAVGGAGWLEIREAGGCLEGALLWMGGSPETQSRIYLDGDSLCCIRVRNDEIRDDSGNVVRIQVNPITLTAKVSGDTMNGVLSEPAYDSRSVIRQQFTGMRIPPLPPRPDLAKLRFGAPIELFNGRNLDGWAVIGGPHWAQVKSQTPGANPSEGWVPMDKDVANGWSVKDGVLINDPVQHEGQPHLRYGNLATRDEFEDFRLSLEVNVLPGGNSGIYLRGIYEVQVIDSFGKPLDCHNMGAIYGRITPSTSAEKPAGEWQSLDILLVDRHATITLNGKVIIDNEPLAGCTGGALWSNEALPGPVYFQGDHTGVQYRNIVLRPVIK